MKILLNNRFTFLEFKNDEKCIRWCIRFSAIAQLQKAPITASLENVPDFPLMGKNVINFSYKMFQVLIFEEIHITEYYLIKFLVKYLEPWKELTIFAWSKPLQKCCTDVTFGHLSWFSWTWTIISFFHFKDYFKEIRLWKEKHMLTDYLATTSVSTNPPHFHEEKNSPKLNDCQILNVIKVLGYSTLVFINFRKKKRNIF